jgi:hypothetical protein
MGQAAWLAAMVEVSHSSHDERTYRDIVSSSAMRPG